MTTEELKARAWAIHEVRARSRAGVVARDQRMRARPPMSVARFQAVKGLLGWSNVRAAAELGVSSGSIYCWGRGKHRVPRTVELALMFCLLRDQPTKARENAEILAKIP